MTMTLEEFLSELDPEWRERFRTAEEAQQFYQTYSEKEWDRLWELMEEDNT
jgi:hypothetical protein